jgi:riboflavin biosynthesis pyrimidine reductase
MQQLYPPPAPGTAPDLPGLYAYPAGSGAWVRAGMVASADGAASVDGQSGGLSGPPDRVVFGLLRSLADVILVGAATVAAEGYRPARVAPRWAPLRGGRPAAPPIAVLSGRLDLDLDGPLLAGQPTDGARTMVITAGSAPEARRAAVARRAEVIVAGRDRVDLPAAVAELAGRGLHRVLAEGGPHLLGQLAAAGRLDELCVTVSPVLAGGAAGRIIEGPPSLVPAAPAALELASVLTEDGFLLCRYVRRAAGPAEGPAGPPPGVNSGSTADRS